MSKPAVKTLLAEELQPEIGIITGTRPGIIMMAPVVRELQKRGFPFFVIHSAQHYSPSMDGEIFRDLKLPAPDYRLEGTREQVTHGAQTAVMLQGIEQILLERKPRIMLIYGDTNSNLAAALAARKLRIPIAHVEAGERCHEWDRPEEQNRKIIDVISDYLFTTGEKACNNLRREGIPEERIITTGNPIVDISIQEIGRAREESDALVRFGLQAGEYGLMTIHREENTDDPARLTAALEGVSQAAETLDLPTVLLLAHPRTLARLEQFGKMEWARALPRLRIEPGVAFLDFLALLAQARLAFTDSGGVAQETLIHRVPAVILVNKTEWTEAVDVGAHILAGCDREKILAAAQTLDANKNRDWGWPFGTPDSSEKICDVLIAHVERAASAAAKAKAA